MSSPRALWQRLTEPSTDGDQARRQEAVLLNVLGGLIVLSLVTQVAQLARVAMGSGLAGLAWWGINVGFLVGVLGLVRLTRGGRPRLAALIVSALLGLLGLAVLLADGLDNAMWALVFGLCVVLSTILLGGRVGLAVAVAGGTIAVFVAALIQAGAFEPLAEMSTPSGAVSDGLGVFAVLGFIAAVCVLYVRDVGTSVDQILTNGAEGSPLRQLRTSSLSVREVEVVRLIAEGLTNDEIAQKLFISPRTVQTHVKNAMSKTEAANRTVLGVLAVREGLVPMDTSDASDLAHEG